MAKANTDNIISRTAIEEVKDGLSELETLTLSLRNMAYAIRMLASSAEMPKGRGGALDSIADKLVNDLDYLIIERERLWGLALEAVHPPKHDKAEAA
jgi:hypothetical protein